VGTDGSAPSLYGDGWTNSLDAHVASNDQGGYSIYDIDGARYDYNTPLGNGVWAPPTGQYAIFYIDPSNPNYVYWIKKDGTIYLFFMPNLPASIAGYDGKLLAIYGRNTNNNVVLNYSWDSGDASSPYKLAQIVVSHSDGQSITLQFGNVGPQRVLASLLRSDGAAVNYSYTIPGTNLVQLYAVYELPNNNTSIPQRYGWYGTGHQLNFAVSPRWNNSNALDGAYTSFTYANNEVNSITYVGYANPTPTDGTNTPMQQGFGASGPYRVTAFTYNSGNTVLSDRDGHGTSWTYDSLGRVTQTQEWNGSAWFTATQSWDNANNLLTTTDLRGNPTDYAYDNNGNTIAIAAPANNGFRATSYYSYDSHNNVTSYCDGVYSHAHSMDWMSRPAPSDTLCPSAPYTSRYTWDTSDTAEPFGKLTDTYTPMSYHTHLTYDPNSQGGDFGLATTIAGDGFSQLDGSTWTPKQILTYNSQGDPVTYDKGDGAWTLSYDTFNRLTMTVDPDNVHTYACYFYNGQIRAMTSAVQYALDSNTACSTHSALYSYDTDGDQTQDIRHYNNENSITDKWYDGDDRLIEVGMPQDGNDYNNKRDYYPWRWLTRYIYDLGQGNAQLFNSQISLYGHGNLIKTQEYTYNESQTWTPPSTAPQGTVHWQDIRGNSYDTLDRSTLKVSFVQGAIQQWSATYDVGYTGLLTKACDPLNNCSNASYTPLNQLLSVSFTGSATPSRTYSYDADGRVSSILSSTFGTEAYQYDYDGRMSMKTESGGGGFTSPATMTYSYYPNAARSALTLSSSAVSQTNLLVYNYRPDGALSSEKYNWTGRTNANINFSYTAAGRINARSDGEQGGSPNSYTYNYEFQGQPNATGRLSQLVIQQGTYAGFTYDAENENTAYTFTDHNNVTSNWSTSYNVRGEIVGQNLPNTSNTTYISANGYMIPSATPSQADGPPTTTFDTYMSALRERITSFTDDNGTTTFDLKVGFDAAGRQTSQTQSGSLSRTYDAENHVSSAAYTSWPIQGGTPRHPGGYWNKNFSYVWGATGHPATINGESLHWDGDTLLFVTNSTGQLDDLKLGVSADHTPLSNYSNVTFSDRDGGGSQVACHNTNGASAVVFPTALRQSPKPCYQDPAAPKFSMQDTSEATIGNGGILWSPGSDGYSDGDVIVQGARAYDVNLGTWTTPDDYPGDVNSPASQKPYEWNSNNSLSYADFSGYDDQNQPPDSQPPVTCTGGIAMVCVPEAFPPM
ncbi:MAG: RHS repeat protein, partial [Candidatus Eremiobacteraeota bacterium]|nr:RHS repeat protein [Candidatus Eremiobacteraeota bacterium]